MKSWICFKASVLVILFVFMFGTSSQCEGKSMHVGIFKDNRSGDIDGAKATLEEAGMRCKVIEPKDLTAENIADLDVIFFPGGWKAHQFLNFEKRLLMTDFVAQGKGILDGAFRSGAIRTGNRPVFPEVGTTVGKTPSNYVLAKGKHPLLEGVPEKMFHSGWDQLVVGPGPLGTPFFVDSGNKPVCVYGEIFNGRYIIIAWFIGIGKDPIQGGEKPLFLNCIRWLGSGKRLEGKALAKSRADAELTFRRREKVWDYALGSFEGRQPGSGPGIIPRIFWDLEPPLEIVKNQLLYQEQWLKGENLRKTTECRRQVETCLNRLRENYESILQKRIVDINAMTLAELVSDDPEQFEKDLPTMLVPEADQATIDATLADAKALMAANKALVKTGRAQQEARSHKQDLAIVPALIKQCDSTDVKQRRRAAQELGRIGDARGIATLIKLIDDQDELVRKHAVTGLGWMQAKESVPQLINATSSRDKWVRRRAVQALGQIGDQRATKTLLGLLDHADYSTRENAIFALGWLRDPQAVPALLNILKTKDRQDPEQRELMCDAIRALGHIGDKRALPVLQNLAETADDFPWQRSVHERIENIHSTYQSLGLQGFSELAIKEIESNKQVPPGVKQPEYLALNKNFYGLREQFNFLGGRPRWKLSTDPDALLNYLWGAGGTGFHYAWGDMRGATIPDFDAYMKLLSDYDFQWIDVMPVGINGPFGSRRCYEKYRAQKVMQKAGCEENIFFHNDHPAFRGFWTEETYPIPVIDDAAFESYLREKYGPDFRKKLELSPDEKISVPDNEDRLEHKQLWAEYLTMGGEITIDDWRESQEWLHGLRKGCAFTFSITAPSRISNMIGVYPKAGAVIDAHGPEMYESFGRDRAFIMDLARDGEVRPVMCEFYNFYSPSVAHTERGFAQHLMHGECFYTFSIDQQIGKYNYTLNYVWNKDFWAAAKRVFLKARQVKDYLGRTGSGANIAQIYSDRTSTLFYCGSLHDHTPLPRRYYQNQSGLWTALQQSHLPTDAIWAETLTPEKLNRYRLVVLSDAKSLMPEQVSIIRDWVKAGGILLATGSTTLFDQWGGQTPDYALADVFGVSYRQHVAKDDPERIDTYCRLTSKSNVIMPAPTRKVIDEGLDPARILNSITREAKPEKSIGMFKTMALSPYLPGIRSGTCYEYDMPLGYDRVSVTNARILAQWDNGDPAITINDFGKGHCVFWTEIYPGLCYRTSGWENLPERKIFWPGVRELLSAMIKGSMNVSEALLPVEVINCPSYVEVTVRTQPEHRRWIVHLLNYDVNVKTVSECSLTLRPPVMDNLRVFYPDTGTEIDYFKNNDGITLGVRNFDIHEMLVVEY